MEPHRKCYACSNCQPMFPKPVERSPKSPRAKASPAPRHACARDHSRSSSNASTSSSQVKFYGAPDPDKMVRSMAFERPSGLTPPETSSNTCFPNIDKCMDEARAKYAADPSLLPPPKPLAQYVPTPEDLDHDERLDAALKESSTLIAEIKEQLAAPCVAPAELTPAEEAENHAAKRWASGYEIADALTDKMASKNDKRFDELIDLIDEVNNSMSLQVPKDQETRDWVSKSKETWQEPAANGEVKLLPIEEFAKPANATTQTKKLGIQAAQQTTSSASAAQRRAKSKQGWQTLWICDYKITW